MLGVGPEGGAQLQLLAPLDQGSPIARFLERSGPGLQQLAYRVADVEQAAGVFRARGVRVLYDEPRRGTAGSRINSLPPKDCGGGAGPLAHPPGRARAVRIPPPRCGTPPPPASAPGPPPPTLV